MAGGTISTIGDSMLKIGNSLLAASLADPIVAVAYVPAGLVMGGVGLAIWSVGTAIELVSGAKDLKNIFSRKSKEQENDTAHSEKPEKTKKNKKGKSKDEEHKPLLSHAQSMGVDDEKHGYKQFISSPNVDLSKQVSPRLKKAGYEYQEHRHPDTKELIERTYYEPGKKEPSFTINKNGAYIKDPDPSAETIRATLSEMGAKKVRPNGDPEMQAKVFIEAEKLNIECEISPEALEIVKAQKQKLEAKKELKAIAPRENVNYKPVDIGSENGKEYILLKKADEKISGHYKLTKDECVRPEDFERIKNQYKNEKAETISLAKDGNRWQVKGPVQEHDIRQSQARERCMSTDSEGRPKSKGRS